MSEDQDQTKGGFYEQKGMVRHMVILTVAHKTKLKKVAKTYNITQGEVLEVMLDQMNLGQLGGHLEAKRASKGEGKTSKTELIKKLKDMTPEQMAAIEAIINQKREELK